MRFIAKQTEEQNQLRSVTWGQWGTIGPHFLKANQEIASFAQVKHALVTFSASAALETVLRGKNIGFGDCVAVADWSDPIDAMTVAAVGATPLFVGCGTQEGLSVSHLGDLTVKAVVADYPCDVAALSAYCKEKNIYFILNLGDTWGAKQHGEPIGRLADACVVDMSQGCTLDLGLCGCVLTDSQEDFDLFYAYHNCGRPMGDGATLTFDAIVGGDLRVAEFQASMIPLQLAQLAPLTAASEVSAKRERAGMAKAPFFQSDYFKKLTTE